MDLYAHVLDRIEAWISPINARGLLRRATARVGVEPANLETRHLPALIRALAAPAALYLSHDEARTLVEQLSTLGGAMPSGRETIEISREADVGRARQRARELIAALGGSSFAAQRAATAVSELARNIHAYTPGGAIELEPDASRRQLRIVAVDRGAGIAKLDEVLSGHYRSRTGMGLGLRGTRRIVDRFDVETGPQGTRVRVEVTI